MTTTRKVLLEWLSATMTARHWSAEQWARKADIAPTTLTRFINGSGHWVLSYKTLEKLADAAGVAIPTPGGDSQERQLSSSRHVPVLNFRKHHDRITRRVLREMAQQATEYVISDGQDCGKEVYAVQITSPSFMGVMIGDVVIFEPNPKELYQADLVVVRDRHGFGLYAYHPPLLIPRSAQSDIEPIRVADAEIIGKALQLTRRLTRS